MANETVRLAVPDLISNSYFPAIAAIEMGFLADAGYDASVELIFPVRKSMEALASGEVDFVAGAAHATVMAFPEWRGAKLLGALAKHMYWFLIVRTDLNAKRGDLQVVKGLRIGAAPGVDLGLRQLLTDAGIEPEANGIEIVPIPGLGEGSVSFGINAAKALSEGVIDAFWANGMGAEVAVRDGVGTVLLDVRRGDGPPVAQGYTFGALVATDTLREERPELARAMLEGLLKAHKRLSDDPQSATPVGRKIFPEREAELIAELIARDVPYYSAVISEDNVKTLNAFARAAGLPAGDPGFDDVVAPEMRELWT